MTFLEQCIVKTKREFHWSRLLLRHRDWRTVAYTPWLPYNAWQAVYIIWRWLLACYFCTWLIVSGNRMNNTPYFLLTKWDFVTWVAYLIVSALSCTVKFTFHMMKNNSVNTDLQLTKRENMENGNSATVHKIVVTVDYYRTDNVAWYQKIHWILFNIALPLEIGITVLYWFQLYNPADDNGISGINFNAHLAPSLIALADVWISGTVLNIYHFYLIFLFGIVYSRYYAVGGVDQFGNSYNYPPLYYGCIPFFILYLISLPRLWLSNKFHKSCYKE